MGWPLFGMLVPLLGWASTFYFYRISFLRGLCVASRDLLNDGPVSFFIPAREDGPRVAHMFYISCDARQVLLRRYDSVMVWDLCLSM